MSDIQINVDRLHEIIEQGIENQDADRCVASLMSYLKTCGLGELNFIVEVEGVGEDEPTD